MNIVCQILLSYLSPLGLLLSLLYVNALLALILLHLFLISPVFFKELWVIYSSIIQLV